MWSLSKMGTIVFAFFLWSDCRHAQLLTYNPSSSQACHLSGARLNLVTGLAIGGRNTLSTGPQVENWGKPCARTALGITSFSFQRKQRTSTNLWHTLINFAEQEPYLWPHYDHYYHLLRSLLDLQVACGHPCCGYSTLDFPAKTWRHKERQLQ